jgi:RNase adaptor protein for sRNA GlmZ degradation
MADILVITGLSGAGRSATAAVLEDLDWYVVDNLPTSLVDTIVELASAPGSGIERLALVAGRQHLELMPKVAKTKLLGLFDDVREHLQTTVESFGFKHGLPLDADIVMDARFLPNPHWDENLRPLSGLDQPVRDFVLGQEQAEEFVAKLVDLLATIVPLYAAEGKSYLTIAIGCTGGRHRSVAIATEIADRMRASGQPVRVGHRDIGR